MALPSKEEVIAEIDRLAAEKGINRDVFRQTVQNESGFNPAAIGDGGKSGGLAQLFTGGGLGNTYMDQTGGSPFNPDEWKQHLAFMADQIVSGGKGLEPWHGWKGSPDAWQTGDMAQAQAPAQPSRGRGGQVMPPAQVQATPGQGQAPAQGNEGLLAELKKMMKPERTIGSELFKMTGLKNEGDASTLGGYVWNVATGQNKKDANAQKALSKENPFSAVPTTTDKLAKKSVGVPMSKFFTKNEDPSTMGGMVKNGILSLFG